VIHASQLRRGLPTAARLRRTIPLSARRSAWWLEPTVLLIRTFSLALFPLPHEACRSIQEFSEESDNATTQGENQNHKQADEASKYRCAYASASRWLAGEEGDKE